MSTAAKKTGSTLALTAIALAGFAANSLLARAALAGNEIDAASFTAVRIFAGAFTLVLIARVARRSPAARHSGSWLSAGALFVYAIAFSFAYVRIGAATGALVLFGAVQATMIGAALRAGERPGVAQWIGIAIALAGLVRSFSRGSRRPIPPASR